MDSPYACSTEPVPRYYHSHSTDEETKAGVETKQDRVRAGGLKKHRAWRHTLTLNRLLTILISNDMHIRSLTESLCGLRAPTQNTQSPHFTDSRHLRPEGPWATTGLIRVVYGQETEVRRVPWPGSHTAALARLDAEPGDLFLRPPCPVHSPWKQSSVTTSKPQEPVHCGARSSLHPSLLPSPGPPPAHLLPLRCL